MENLSFTRFKIRWFIVLSIFMSIVSGIFFFVFEDSPYANDLAGIILAGALTLYIIFQWKGKDLSFNEALISESMNRKRWTKYIGYTVFIKLFGIVAMVFVSSLILYLFKDSLGWILDLLNNIEVAKMTPLNFVFLFISICILAPLWEELFFRGIVLRRMAKRWKVSTSIIVSSLLFGIMHFGGNSVIHAALFGALMAVAYLRTKNIWVPIILHSFSNFLSFLALFLPGSEEAAVEVPSDEEMLTVLVTTSIIFVIFVAIFIYFLKKNWQKIREIPRIQEPVVAYAGTVGVENQHSHEKPTTTLMDSDKEDDGYFYLTAEEEEKPQKSDSEDKH